MNPTSKELQTLFQTKMEEQLYHQLGGVEHDLMMAQIRIEELQDVANHTKRHNDYLIIQNEELEARNKILIETGHWIGQNEAHDLKIAVENFLAEPFFGPQEYRNLREALNACNPHRCSNFDDFLKEDSENRD